MHGEKTVLTAQLGAVRRESRAHGMLQARGGLLLAARITFRGRGCLKYDIFVEFTGEELGWVLLKHKLIKTR